MQNRTVCLSQHGRRLAIGNGVSGISDLASGNAIPVSVLESAVGLLHFSPDESLLAVVCPEGVVHLVDACRGSVLHTLRHRSGVREVAFSADTKTVAVATAEGFLTLWHTSTAQELGMLPTGEGDIFKLQFSSDNRSLAAVAFDPLSTDTHVYLWPSGR